MIWTGLIAFILAYAVVWLSSFVVMRGRPAIRLHLLWVALISLPVALYCGCVTSHWTVILVHGLFFAGLASIALIDIYYKEIYDLMILTIGAITYGLSLIFGINHWNNILLGILAGGIFYGLIYFITYIIYKEESFGLGDVMLNMLIGGFLGLWPSIISSFLTFVIAAIILLFILIFKRSLTRKTPVPFAPAMCISALVVTLYYAEIVYIILRH